MRRFLPLLVLATSQFVMVLDTSVMNVSITRIVEDLGTTIAGVQGTITAYALVMAMTMLVGARLGDIWGAHRTYALGLGLYAVGSLVTALSPNLLVLLIGWSLVQGLGAALVMPAVLALTTVTYEGRDRALAFGVLGGVTGAAVAAGPVIGGWVTATFTWRYVFAAEAVVILGVLLTRRLLGTVPARPSRFDLVGAVMSGAGLGMVVLGVLQGASWGWVLPAAVPVVGGVELAPLGFSPVPFLVFGGLGLLALLSHRLERRIQQAQPVLVDLRLLEVIPLRVGLITLLLQQFVLLGAFFVLPVYLQVIVGQDAFTTGLTILPMSASLVASALIGPRLAAGWSIRRVVQLGIVLLAVGALLLAAALDPALVTAGFTVGLVVFGAGAGLMMSQLGNVIMSSAGSAHSSEAGGLQGTAQNLGAALGTALVGSVLLAGLSAGFAGNVVDGDLDPPVRDAVVARAQAGVDMVPLDVARSVARDAGLAAAEVEEVVAAYGQAQLQAFKVAILLVALAALLTLWPARRIPAKVAADSPG